jgi:hypothetical protein
MMKSYTSFKSKTKTELFTVTQWQLVFNWKTNNACYTNKYMLGLDNQCLVLANRGRMPVRKNIMNRIVEEKENMNIVKRKLDDRSVDRLNTSKRRRVSNSVKRKFARLSGKQSGLKYNLSQFSLKWCQHNL